MLNVKTVHTYKPALKNFLLVKAEKVSSLRVVLKSLSDEHSHVSKQGEVSLPKTFYDVGEFYVQCNSVSHFKKGLAIVNDLYWQLPGITPTLILHKCHIVIYTKQ